MYSYALLEKNCHYLIQEKEGDPITLIKINFETDYCAYVSKFADTTLYEWRKKADPIFEILELLDDNQVKDCLLYTSPSPRDGLLSRMPSSA